LWKGLETDRTHTMNMVSLVSLPVAWQFKWDVPADLSLLRNKTTMHWGAIKRYHVYGE